MNKLKDLIIVGVGGFGREAYYLVKSLGKWNIKGFIGNVGDNPKDYRINLPMLGVIEEYQPKDNEVFVMGISSPSKKEKFASILQSKGAIFETLISPRAHINETAEIGEGSIINGSIGDCVKIGKFVNVMGSMIGQDSVIGDFSTTTGYTNIASAYIGKRVFIGSHAVVLNGLTVGDDAYICAGSIVFSKVKAGTKVFGCPAKKMDF